MSETRVKHMLKLTLLFLLLLSLALPAMAAGNAEIGVTVPGRHIVTVVCGTGGSVTVGQSEYIGTSSFSVARHSDFSLTAVPDDGYELVSVTGSNVCELTFAGSAATLNRVNGDTELAVVFRAEEQREVPVGIFIPVTSESDSIAAEAVITEAEASIALDEAELGGLLTNEAEVGTVSVDVSNVGVDISTVAIPVSAVRAIAEQSEASGGGLPGMSVAMPRSKVTLDSTALSSVARQAESESVKLHVEKVSEDELNPVQQEAIADAADNKIIVTVTLKSGDKLIRDFEGGSVEIALPYAPKENEDTDTITVWFVSEDGVLEEIPCRYGSGVVCFTVYHFSEYLIKPGAVTAAPDTGSYCFICELIGRDIAPWCWLLPLSIAAAALAAVFAVLYTKRKDRR